MKPPMVGTGALGKVRLSEVTPIPDLAWWVILASVAFVLFRWLEKIGRRASTAS